MKVSAFALEEAVLGCAMNDGSIVPRCGIAGGDFVLPPHQMAWTAIQRLYDRQESTDALSVTELLDKEQAPPPKGGWLQYLANISRETAAPKLGPEYAAKLKSGSLVRQAQMIGRQLMALERDGEIDSHIRSLIELATGTKSHTCHIQEAMQEAIDLMDQNQAAVPTGLKDLDACLGGLHDEDLIIVGARPAAGKTAYMLNLALAANGPVGIISGEQGRGQIGMRLIAIDRLVSLHKMRTGALDREEWARVSDAVRAAKDKNIWVYDKPAPNIDDVIRQARQWKYERKISLFMVDYLQKLTGGQGENFRLQVGDTVSRLKDLARELKIPVVVLAQVKREIESRNVGPDGLGRMPYAGDIAESGIIEQEADVVMTLYRPEVYDDRPEFKGLAYVNICKNRHGPVGHKRIAWRGEFLQFGDLAYHEGDRWAAA